MIKDIKLIVFDFDGVLTDNTFLVDSQGKEYVRCNRGDGLAFRAFSKIGLKAIICSTEKNNVVKARGEKLKVETHNGIENKLDFLKEYANSSKISPKNILFIGNDLNDYKSMKYCGLSACPADGISEIKEIATFVLCSKGGDGVAREILEKILKIDLLEVLYNN